MIRWWLVIHVLGSVVFLGNIIVTFFWKLMADRSRDQKVLAFSQRLVTKTDRVFTAFGAGLLAMSGYAYAGKLQLDLINTPWLFWAQICFYASALIWALLLLPIQHKQSKMAQAFENGGPIPDEYWRLARRWNALGTVATVLPALSLVMMVIKHP